MVIVHRSKKIHTYRTEKKIKKLNIPDHSHRRQIRTQMNTNLTKPTEINTEGKITQIVLSLNSKSQINKPRRRSKSQSQIETLGFIVTVRERQIHIS